MKLVQIDGFYINPSAIAYVSTKSTGPMDPQGRTQVAVLHFVGGTELTMSSTAGVVAQTMEKA